MLAALAVNLMLATTATAEVNEKFADLSDEIEMVRSIGQTERQALVTEAMQLTPGESQAFWPVYRKYRVDITTLNDRLVKVITDYAAASDSLTDKQARSLLDELLRVQAETVNVRQKYVSRFAKVLPGVKLARFYQIENKIDTVLSLEFVEAIPLAR